MHTQALLQLRHEHPSHPSQYLAACQVGVPPLLVLVTASAIFGSPG